MTYLAQRGTQDFGNPAQRGGMSVQINMYLSQPGTSLTSENVLCDSEINLIFAVIARKRILHRNISQIYNLNKIDQVLRIP